jgi:signal transduction histidine kinase
MEKFRYKINEFEAEKMKFLKLINHEINTPQTKMDMAVQELLRKHSELKNSESIFAIKSSLKQLHKLISTMNKYHFYKEQFKPNYYPCDVIDLIKDVIDDKIMSSINSGRKLDIVKEISRNIPKILNMDCNAVTDVLNILVDNSIRFSPDNSRIIVGARLPLVEKEKLANKKTIVLYVSDQGKGIDKRQRDKIFKPFYEGGDINSHKSGTLEYLSGGLGLGLALAKQIVTALGGFITFESDPNVKTLFYILLPIENTKQ